MFETLPKSSDPKGGRLDRPVHRDSLGDAGPGDPLEAILRGAAVGRAAPALVTDGGEEGAGLPRLAEHGARGAAEALEAPIPRGAPRGLASGVEAHGAAGPRRPERGPDRPPKRVGKREPSPSRENESLSLSSLSLSRSLLRASPPFSWQEEERLAAQLEAALAKSQREPLVFRPSEVSCGGHWVLHQIQFAAPSCSLVLCFFMFSSLQLVGRHAAQEEAARTAGRVPSASAGGGEGFG